MSHVSLCLRTLTHRKSVRQLAKIEILVSGPRRQKEPEVSSVVDLPEKHLAQ